MADGFLILRHIAVRGNSYECPLRAGRVLRDVASRHVEGIRKGIRAVSIAEKVNKHENCPRRRFDTRGFGPSAAGCECTPGPSPNGRSRIAVNACSHCLAWHTIGRHVPPIFELVSLRCFPCRSPATPLCGPADATLLFEFGNRMRALRFCTMPRSQRHDQGAHLE
jgi:hypothetical protein